MLLRLSGTLTVRQCALLGLVVVKFQKLSRVLARDYFRLVFTAISFIAALSVRAVSSLLLEIPGISALSLVLSKVYCFLLFAGFC